MPVLKQPTPLETRIRAVRADAEKFFDELAAREVGEASGVPLGVIRMTMVARYDRGGDECRAYLQWAKANTAPREPAAS